jgi:hypothetical protein
MISSADWVRTRTLDCWAGTVVVTTLVDISSGASELTRCQPQRYQHGDAGRDQPRAKFLQLAQIHFFKTLIFYCLLFRRR